jgi:hypothetical protein
MYTRRYRIVMLLSYTISYGRRGPRLESERRTNYRNSPIVPPLYRKRYVAVAPYIIATGHCCRVFVIVWCIIIIIIIIGVVISLTDVKIV